MDSRKKKAQRNDWYSISVDSLRALTALLIVAAAAGIGFFGYRAWQRGFEKESARAALESAQELAAELRSKSGISNYEDDYHAARNAAAEAQGLFDQGDFRRALAGARSSRDVLQWILDSLEHRGPVGEARFVSVQGEVDVRRGESGDWEPARRETTLNYGDYVRTGSNGSAEVMFSNGTLSSVRQGTMILVTRPPSAPAGSTAQAIAMKYGWVNLNTGELESNVITPDADARVESNSQATVTYDQGRGESRFVSYQGEMRVAAKNGVERVVRPLEQVIQQRDRIGQPAAVPGRVALDRPAANYQVNLDNADTLELAWEPVPGASHYALQVARNPHFVDNVIEDAKRSKPTAKIGLRAEGSFDWRVAAIDKAGVQGPWSEPRKFRVSSFSGNSQRDTVPPRLDIQYIRPYGSIFILGGATEPGSELEVNGEPVTVQSDGSFTKTVQLAEEGWSFLSIRARDLAGNVTERRPRVFVELF